MKEMSFVFMAFPPESMTLSKLTSLSVNIFYFHLLILKKEQILICYPTYLYIHCFLYVP